MADIVIKKTVTGDGGSGGAGGTAPLTLNISNFQSFNWELTTPVFGTPLPEECDTENILIKVEGNELISSPTWTIVEQMCSVVTELPCVKTVQQQIDFILKCFQAVDIEDKYTLTADGVSKNGTIRKTTITKTSDSPVTYTATVAFIAGNVVASDQDENPVCPS